MEAQEIKNIRSVKNLLVWQIPLFVVFFALWLFNIFKDLILSDTSNIKEKIFNVVFSYSNPISPLINPFGLFFFFAWLVLGLLGLRTSIKYLKTATENKKPGKTLLTISIIMLVLVTLTLVSFCSYLIT